MPDAFLCVGDTGFGDYIIRKVGEDGAIAGWKAPTIKAEEWKPCVETFDQADELVEKLLTGTDDEFRLPLADARKMGGLLKELLADMR